MHLLERLESLPWVLGASIMVAVFVGFTLSGILLIRKFANPATFKAHHDVAGFVFTNLGVIYAVLLGFTVVNVQQRFDKINDITQVEASFLSELYRDSEVFPEESRNRIRLALKNYGESVLNVEWNMMSTGKRSQPTIDALHNIWNAYYAINLTNKKEEIWYSESIGKLNQLLNARLSRVLGSKQSLGTEMWTLLILGTLSLVVFLWFFGLENLTVHLLMASILAASTAFLLFLIYSLDTAFTGAVSIQPDAFLRVVNSLD